MYPARSSTRKDNFVYAQGCLRKDGAHPLVIENFRVQYQKLLRRETGLISRAQIRPVAELPDLGAFAGLAAAGREALERCVVIKLNGGLGTSMGLERAKSLIAVKDGLSFLDIIVRQVLQMRRALNIPLPLLLMNSFNTRDDTLAALEPYPELAQGQGGVPVAFRQNRVPKLLRKDLRPARCEADPSLEWCPPGHGDIYTSLHTTGLLDLLLARGIEYAFVSNADNLGALLDLSILGAMHTRKIPFLMEVTTRTEADRKGGHIGRAPDGRLLLRELAQCPEEELEEFQDINLFRYFNTNNLWLNLAALKARLVAGGGVLDLPLIINYKTVDPKDLESDAVIQLETAMGAAIALFEGACAVRVPRERFAPV